MRTRLLVLLAVAVLPLAAASQDSGPSFVVQLKYTKIDLPYSSSSSCLTVFPDGRFHMEQMSDWPRSAPRVFEDLLPSESLKSLSAILDGEGLKELKVAKGGPETISHGEIFGGVISRGQTIQTLVFSALQASAGQVARPFPPSLLPLVQWVDATTKDLKKRKLRELKGGKALNCQPGEKWFPEGTYK